MNIPTIPNLNIEHSDVLDTRVMTTAYQSNIDDFDRLDLSTVIRDESLSIKRLANLSIHQGEVVGNIRVFDFDQVYIHQNAKSEIKNAYITPLYLIEAYARNNGIKLLRKLSRGNDKGLYVLDSTASTYVHLLNNGRELIVQGENLEIDGKYTRRLTISCRDGQMDGGAK